MLKALRFTLGVLFYGVVWFAIGWGCCLSAGERVSVTVQRTPLIASDNAPDITGAKQYGCEIGAALLRAVVSISILETKTGFQATSER